MQTKPIDWKDVEDSLECICCGESKTLNNFRKSGINKNGFQTYYRTCKLCISQKEDNWITKILESCGSRSKRKAKEKYGKTFQLTREFIKNLAEKQQYKCYWLDIPLTLKGECKFRQPSIDRIDSSKGYTEDNVVLSSLFANIGRKDSSESEFKQFVKEYIKK